MVHLASRWRAKKASGMRFPVSCVGVSLRALGGSELRFHGSPHTNHLLIAINTGQQKAKIGTLQVFGRPLPFGLQQGQRQLSINMAFVGGLVTPHRSVTVKTYHTIASGVHHTDAVLGFGMPLFRSLANMVTTTLPSGERCFRRFGQKRNSIVMTMQVEAPLAVKAFRG
jgi:hypothetical protein